MTEEGRKERSDESPAEEPAAPPDSVGKSPALSRGQRIVAKSLGVVLATAVAILIAELLLRIYWRPPEYSWFPRYALRADPYTGARYGPNLRLRITYSSPDKRFRFTTNSMGFRSRELPEKKPPDAFRVLFVGDSFTEGFGVNDDETFPFYFEQFVRRMAPKIEVINAGQNATDMPEYAAFIRGYARRLSPDLVVLSLYAGNDIPIEGPPNPPPRYAMSYGFRVSRAYANRVRSIHVEKEGGDRKKETWILVARPGSLGARLDRWLHHHLLFYRLASEQLVLRLGPARALLKALGWIEIEPDKEPVVLGIAKAQMFLKEKQPDVEQKTSESLEQLREIKRICDELHIPLFVQIIPYIPTLPRFEPLWDWLWPQWTGVWEKRLGRPPTRDDFDKNLPNDRMRRLVEAAGIPYIDLGRLHEQAVRFDEFQPLTFGASLGHFTPDENLFDAAVLVHELTARGMLPEGVTTGGLEAIWRKRYSAVQLPFFPPPSPPVPAGKVIAGAFDRGRVVSSFEGVGGDPASYVKAGYFTPVFNVQPVERKARKGDFIEFIFRPDERKTSLPLVLAIDICRPATDPSLDAAVRQSVRLGGREIWSSPVTTDPHGGWRSLVLACPAVTEATTISIRAEAARDFEAAPSGEFPLLLRLRRLRLIQTGRRLKE